MGDRVTSYYVGGYEIKPSDPPTGIDQRVENRHVSSIYGGIDVARAVADPNFVAGNTAGYNRVTSTSVSGGVKIPLTYEDSEGDNCHVYVFTLGGTIDKDYPKVTSGYAFEFGEESAVQRILEGHPTLGLSYKIKSVCQKDSLEITSGDRNNLRCDIDHTIGFRKYQSELLRIVVTHGTDTMIETAMYIKKEIEAEDYGNPPPRYVIAFTGATKPERFVDSDASFNVGCAVAATACCEPGSVVICMNGNVIPVEQCARDEKSGLFREVLNK